jgi:TfoX/Sxy family transcriptional regulator of competence genes
MAWKKVSPELSQILAEAMAAFPAQKKIMFGCPAYFVNGNMFAGVHQDSVMIRLSGADQNELQRQNDEVSHFEPMPGRPMKEYLVLPISLLEDAREFSHWLQRSFDYASSLPPKQAKAGQNKPRPAAKKR